MSRLMEFAACCKNMFVWDCCRTSENNAINVKRFGNNIRKKINVFNSWCLFNEHNIYLHEKNETKLKIGCLPEHFFEVTARIESKSKNVVVLNANELTDLIDFLIRNFDENDAWKCKHQQMKHTRHIELKPMELRKFSLHIGRKYFTIDEETLHAMLRKKSYILDYVAQLDKMRKSCETMLFNLTSHFCYNKTMKVATDLSLLERYVQHFFDEIRIFHCDCVNKNFALEIGANFAKWFAKCVPLFIKTIMADEAERLKTFSHDDWPHQKKIINVKKLAKSGLYYIGEKDVVYCAFCNIRLHDWKIEDNPILDHFKFSPNCPFLSDPKSCYNIAIGDEKKIDELLSIISTVGNDEADMN